MKTRSVRILLILLTALFAGPSWADNVVNTVNQSGIGNKAAVVQPADALSILGPIPNDNNQATILQGAIPFITPGPPGNSNFNLAQINQVNNTPVSPIGQNAIIMQGAGFLDMINNVPFDFRTGLVGGLDIPPAGNLLFGDSRNTAVTDQGATVPGSGYENYSLTIQIGNDNKAYTRQNTGLNGAGIIQTGDNMNAYIEQGNGDPFLGLGADFAKIVQKGFAGQGRHKASIEQTSNPLGTRLPGSLNLVSGFNAAEIRQNLGRDNKARIVQTGFMNNTVFNPAKITQEGQEQKALIYQTADKSKKATIDQGGSLNTAALFQVKNYGPSAFHSAEIVQGPGTNQATQNYALTWQSGFAGPGVGHDATVEQGGAAHTALVYQTQNGTADVASVIQDNNFNAGNLGVVVQGDLPSNLYETPAELGSLLNPVEAGFSGLPPNLQGGPS